MSNLRKHKKLKEEALLLFIYKKMARYLYKEDVIHMF